MKKSAARFLLIWILAATMILTFSTPAYAASSGILPGVSRSCIIKGYCYCVHDVKKKRVYVYSNESCSRRNFGEYVNKQTDECYITATSGRYNNVRISYPTNYGRKERWTMMGAFTTARSYITKYSVKKIPAYKFPSTKNSYGAIGVNKQVRVYETWKGFVRVIYPVSGGYKFAWITEADARRYLSGYVNVAESTYKITTALNTGYALDVNNYAKFNGGNVEIYPYHDTNNEKWRINSVGNGYYTITDVNSGKCLDVKDGASKRGTNVQIWGKNNTNAQKWRFINAGNGYCYIVNANGCYLDVQNGTVRKGNNVWVYTGNATNAQKWKLRRVSVNQKNNNNSSAKVIDIAKLLDKNLETAAASLGFERDYSRDRESGVGFYDGHDVCHVLSTNMIYASNGNYLPSHTYLEGESFYMNSPGKWDACIQDKTYSLYGIKIGMTSGEATRKFTQYNWKKIYSGRGICDYLRNGSVILTTLQNGRITKMEYHWQMESEF